MSLIIPLTDLNDPRLSPYRHLKDRDLAREEAGRFIAESEHVVRRLLASDFEVDSLLLAGRRVAEIAPLASSSTPIYVVPDDLIHSIVGYKFHSGVIACGRQKPPLPLASIISRDGPLTLVVCPDLANNENLGSLMRIAAGFGADAMLIGPHCCDPFYRLSIRVSMGTVFRLPIVRSTNWTADLALLKKHRVQCVATVLDDSAETLRRFTRSDRTAIFFGNEAQGLTPEDVDACDRKLTIPMRLGTDSLNVSVAAGIILHQFSSPA